MGRLHVEQLPFFLKIATYIPYFFALVFSYLRESIGNLIAFILGTKEGKEIMEYGPLVKSIKLQ